MKIKLIMRYILENIAKKLANPAQRVNLSHLVIENHLLNVILWHRFAINIEGMWQEGAATAI